jgi:hypothetical protein
MIELPFEYWNKLASQLIVISSLLGGFSLSIIVPMMENRSESKAMSYLFKATTIATASFLVSIFAMTKILMMTTEGYPGQIADSSLSLPRIIGVLSFFAGIVSIVSIIMLSGYIRGGKFKRFTLIAGSIAMLLILLMLI